MSRVDSAFSRNLDSLLSGHAGLQAQGDNVPAEFANLVPGPDYQESVPYGKGAGVYVPPGTANGCIVLDDSPQAASLDRSAAETSAKSSQASAAAGEEDAGKKKTTAQDIISRRLKSRRSSTYEDLRHGRLCQAWVRLQPERPANEQLDRASAIRVLTRLMREAKCDRKSCRVNRFIGCWHVSKLFGGDAARLTITAIREMAPLIERDAKSDLWSITEKTAAAARALWARMLDQRLSCEEVMAEVEQIRRSNQAPLPIEVQRKKSRLPRLLKSLPEFSADDLRKLIRAARGVLAEKTPGRSDAA